MEDYIATAARIAGMMGGWRGLLIALVIILVGAAALRFFPGLRGFLGSAAVAILKALKKMHETPAPPTLDENGNLPPGQGSKPIKVNPDGTIPLNQKPPPDYL